MTQFIGGILVGFFAAMLLLIILPSTCKLGRDAIVECEKTLPRNQHCKITGVPE